MSDPLVVTSGSRVAFAFERFSQFPLLVAMSGRTLGAPDDGDLGYTPTNDHARIDLNRDAFLRELRIAPDALTLGRQVHGVNVEVVTDADRGRGRPPRFDGFPATDALVTSSTSVVLGTVVADCVPLLVYDPHLHVVALAHAGWRGTVGRMASRVIETMQVAFGSRPSDLVAGIGPSIGPCCYEVGDDVIQAWNAAGVAGADEAIVRRATSYHFDMWNANRLQLLAAGLAPSAVEMSLRCTRCEPERFFSYRAARAGLGPSGRMMMVTQLGDPA